MDVFVQNCVLLSSAMMLLTATRSSPQQSKHLGKPAEVKYLINISLLLISTGILTKENLRFNLQIQKGKYALPFENSTHMGEFSAWKLGLYSWTELFRALFMIQAVVSILLVTCGKASHLCVGKHAMKAAWYILESACEGSATESMQSTTGGTFNVLSHCEIKRFFALDKGRNNFIRLI